MAIKVLFFAGLREQLGKSSAELAAVDAAVVSDVWAQLVPERPMPATVLCAVNQQQATADHPVGDGDEVAFFPPVTGG